MQSPGYVWAACLGGLIALDYWCDRNGVVGDTLSECTRAALRTHTPLGRVVFIGGWCALTGWLVPHICRVVTDA